MINIYRVCNCTQFAHRKSLSVIIDFGSFLECVVVYSLSNSQLVHIELLRKWEKKSEGGGWGWEKEREREREREEKRIT